MISHRKHHQHISMSLLVMFFIAFFAAPLHAQERDALRKLLKGVVAQEKYIYDAVELPSQTPRENTLLDKINRFLKTLWERITAALEKASWLTMLLYALMTASAAAIFILIFRRLDLSRRGPPRNSPGTGTEEFNMDYQREIKKAESYMKQGEKKRAVSTAVNALWLYLHHKGVIRYVKSTTNREYLFIVVDTGLYPPVPGIVRDSETAVYAESTMSDEQCNEILSTIITITAQ